MVYAKGKQVEDIVLKEQIRDFLVEKEMNVVKSIGDHLNLFGLERIIDQKNYKDYEIYQASIDVGLIYRFTILKKNDDIYLMPRDFNKLLFHSNNHSTKDNELIIAEKYVELFEVDDIIIEKSEMINVTLEGKEYDIELITLTNIRDINPWTKINSIRKKWNLKFKNGQLFRFRKEELESYINDKRIDTERNIHSQTFNIKTRQNERLCNVVIKNYLADEITFEDPTNNINYFDKYVIVKKNDNPVPAIERTVNIELSDFTPFSNVDVEITIEKGATIHTLFSQIIIVDSLGNANYDWEISYNVHTGKCKITANGSNEKYFFIYRTLSDDLPEELNYDYKILYGDQFPSFNETDIEAFLSFSIFRELEKGFDRISI